MKDDFGRNELERYSRHMVLPHFGLEGQQKLKRAAVAIVGAGGLGSPVLQYLTAAGIGKIGIIDYDSVSESNLQRQVLFNTLDVGSSKAKVAAIKLKELNPHVVFEVFVNQIDSSNALDLLRPFDLILDCTDNFPTRYLLNDACVLLNKPLIYGSIFRYEGQVSVFNYNGSPTYRDLYPEPPEPGSVPDCEEGGVLGVLPGIIGCLQANEAIKIITGVAFPLAGKLLLFDSLSLQTSIIEFPDRNARKTIKNLIDYDQFCGLSKKPKSSEMKEITVEELKNLKDKGEHFQLIDVREDYEYEICNIGGELIPVSQIPNNIDRISKEKKVIIHCRSGSRSGNIIKWLEKNHQFDNLFNLKGGILAWADEIDPSMTKY